MASGIPSRRRQISTTASASSGVAIEKRGPTVCAFGEQIDCRRVDSPAEFQRGHRPHLLVNDPQPVARLVARIRKAGNHYTFTAYGFVSVSREVFPHAVRQRGLVG